MVVTSPFRAYNNDSNTNTESFPSDRFMQTSGYATDLVTGGLDYGTGSDYTVYSNGNVTFNINDLTGTSTITGGNIFTNSHIIYDSTSTVTTGSYGIYDNVFNDLSAIHGISTYDLPEYKYLEKKKKLKDNQSINIIIPRGSLINNIKENEQIAIETLREEIMESEFRKYMAFGFINVRALSGKIYQIFRNNHHVKVWENGKVIEEVCIYIPDKSIPPTDRVISIKTMIECDENEFKTFGNVYKMQRVA